MECQGTNREEQVKCSGEGSGERPSLSNKQGSGGKASQDAGTKLGTSPTKVYMPFFFCQVVI